MLLDSNIVIYAFQPQHESLRSFLEQGEFAVSAITRLEVLGYWRLSSDEYERLHLFLAEMPLLHVTPAIIEAAIQLRLKRRMGLADALIAATALQHHLPLVTHNLRDFQEIEGLEVIDPL